MARRNQLKTKDLYKKLKKQYDESPILDLKEHDAWVIFSDLHMGDGGSTDDFKQNAQLFTDAIERYYLQKRHALILNGDVEELQRFKLEKIVNRWSTVYSLFDSFYNAGKLYKTVGNHDLELLIEKDNPLPYTLHESIRLRHKDDDLFVFHGHQASKKYQAHNELIGFTLKYFANPLGIKSYSVSHSSQKQFKIEKRAYGFSNLHKIASVIGHTHRPLFESMHKVERIKHKIEQLCREFVEAAKVDRAQIEKALKGHRKELLKYHKAHKNHELRSYVYDTVFQIPCVFNSGCVVGKRGMTCLEIESGVIRLVHWFDKNISKKYLMHSGYEAEQLPDTDFYRLVINEESLDYIFARIKFLS